MISKFKLHITFKVGNTTIKNWVKFATVMLFHSFRLKDNSSTSSFFFKVAGFTALGSQYLPAENIAQLIHNWQCVNLALFTVSAYRSTTK